MWINTNSIWRVLEITTINIWIFLFQRNTQSIALKLGLIKWIVLFMDVTAFTTHNFPRFINFEGNRYHNNSVSLHYCGCSWSQQFSSALIMVSSEHQQLSEEGQECTDGDGEEHETQWIQGARTTYSQLLWPPTASHRADQLSPVPHWLQLRPSAKSDFLHN